MVASRGVESMSLRALCHWLLLAQGHRRGGGSGSMYYLSMFSYSEFIGVRVHHHSPRGTTSALECKQIPECDAASVR